MPETYEQVVKERDHLLKFKNFVHKRFDEISVPSHFSDGEHSKEGCRIGDRIDWIALRLQDLETMKFPEQHPGLTINAQRLVLWNRDKEIRELKAKIRELTKENK